MDVETLRRRSLRGGRAKVAVAAIWIAASTAMLGVAVRDGHAAVAEPNSADRLIMWVSCKDLARLSDAELDGWKDRGVDGFACGIGWLRGMGGTQDFTGDPNASLAGDNYSLQRSLRDSGVIARLRARGMKAYLGAYLVNYWNKSTPLEDWFNDRGWSGLVLPKLGNLAAAAKQLGFAGLSFDQELYPQDGGVEGASWRWNYDGNSHSEREVRAMARQRGQELMRRLLSKFPRIELLAYHVQLPDTWGELVQQKVNGHRHVNDVRLDIDFWDGLSSVEGYSALRLVDAYFYKMPHLGHWEPAFQYHFNKLYAYLSRRLSNWDYASSRFFVSPFAWIDRGPCGCSFEEPRTPTYVASQLSAFRKWGMGGEFANFAYAPLGDFDYTPYAGAMKAASARGVVDAEAPALTVNAPSTASARAASAALRGTARDNLAVRAVRWSNDLGRSGTASMKWQVLSGNYTTRYLWQTRWWIPRRALGPGTRRIRVTAEDIKGLKTTASFRIRHRRTARPRVRLLRLGARPMRRPAR